MTSNNGADSMVAISQCSFVNLKAGMTTYTGTTITNMGKAICYSNDTYSTTTSTTSTTSTSTTMFPETSSSITPIHTEFTSTTSETSSDTLIIDTTIIIKPSDSDTDTDTDTDTDNDCSGLDSDNDNYLILKGECSSCGKPINRKNIIKCLKRSYYNYYSSNYDVDWDLDNMVCDSLLLINIEDDDNYNKNDDGYDDNNNDNIDNNDNQDLNRCRNRYHMTFQLDIVFDSGGTTIDEYDKIKQPITDGNDGNNDDSNISNESQDIDMNLSSYLISCEPEFENMECDISIVESNISPYINNSSSERLFSCHILSFIYIYSVYLVLFNVEL